MRKLIFFTLIALLAVGTISAQGWGNFGPTETTRVEGTLQLQQGQIAISTGTTSFFIPMLNRYIGFVDGLREGARVTVTGYTYGNVIHLTHFSVGGREYDLSTDWGNSPAWGGRGRHLGWGACCHYGAPMGGNRRWGRW
ncbi:MAG: hypothetical protein FWG77_02480 [Treponema sp.]|nr:hypothetical protein [Treponema sp.]